MQKISAREVQIIKEIPYVHHKFSITLNKCKFNEVHTKKNSRLNEPVQTQLFNQLKCLQVFNKGLQVDNEFIKLLKLIKKYSGMYPTKLIATS